MRLLVGDDVGQAKVIETSCGIDTTQPSSARATTTSFFPPSPTRQIQHALAVEYMDRNGLAAVFSQGGLLRIFDPLSPPHSPDIAFSHTLPVPAGTRAIGLSVSGNVLSAATESGNVLFLDLASGEHTTTTFPGPLSLFTASPNTSYTHASLPAAIATGGDGKDTEIFAPRAADGVWTSTWKAKNVKASAIKIEAPIHPVCAIFLPSPPTSLRILVGTKHGHIRIYDTAVGRRPVWSHHVTQNAIQQLQLHPDSQIPGGDGALLMPASASRTAEEAVLATEVQVVFSDFASRFEVFSLTQKRPLGLFKGLSGSVLGVSVAGGVVAGTGFGRYVAAYDAHKRSLLSRVYVKTQCCCVAVLDAEDPVVESAEERDVEVEAEEDVWEGMKEVNEVDDESEGDRTEKLIKIRQKRKTNGTVGAEVREGGGKRPRGA